MKVFLAAVTILISFLGCYCKPSSLMASFKIDHEREWLIPKNVLVKVEGASPLFSEKKYTDDHGNVCFDGLRPGKYRIYCSWIDNSLRLHESLDGVIICGYEPVEKTIHLYVMD